MSYFTKALKHTNGELIETMRNRMSGVKYDTIVGTGLSGTIFTARVAPGLKKDFAIIRKDNDGSHSGNRVEGVVGERWVFADDFVSTGATLRRVLKRMKEDYPDSEFVGVYQYERENFTGPDATAEYYGQWVADIALGGPKLGPLTLQQQRSKFGATVLKAPREGWDARVAHLVPLPGFNLLELDYMVDGVPCFWNLEQGCRVPGTDKRVRLMAEQIRVSLVKSGIYNRFVGVRMDVVMREVAKYPDAAAMRSWKPAPVQGLRDFSEAMTRADDAAIKLRGTAIAPPGGWPLEDLRSMLKGE